MSTVKKKKKAHLTQLPCKLWRTLTHEAIQHCVALAAVLAGFAGALVPLDLAVRANEAGGTQAAEAPRTLLWTKHTESAGDCRRPTHGSYILAASQPCTWLRSCTGRGSASGLRRTTLG